MNYVNHNNPKLRHSISYQNSDIVVKVHVYNATANVLNHGTIGVYIVDSNKQKLIRNIITQITTKIVSIYREKERVRRDLHVRIGLQYAL